MVVVLITNLRASAFRKNNPLRTNSLCEMAGSLWLNGCPYSGLSNPECGREGKFFDRSFDDKLPLRLGGRRCNGGAIFWRPAQNLKIRIERDRLRHKLHRQRELCFCTFHFDRQALFLPFAAFGPDFECGAEIRLRLRNLAAHGFSILSPAQLPFRNACSLEPLFVKPLQIATC